MRSEHVRYTVSHLSRVEIWFWSLPLLSRWSTHEMRPFSQRRMRTLTALCCALTFSMLVLSCTLREPSLYFFRVVLGLSDSTCACPRCISHLNPERDGDGWLMERFNQSFKPLMSRENSFIPDDTYRWWQVSTPHIKLTFSFRYLCRF